MKMSWIDWVLLPVLVAVLAVVVWMFFALAGFLGLGVLGLLVGGMAQRMELEKDGAVSHFMTTSLYADQARARQRMTRAEKDAHRLETEALLGRLFVAKVVSAGFVILGFGGFAVYQLP